jgi:protein-L-isoaspartate O-methyltransferase
MNIDEILALVPDKFEHKYTTSKKFKRDVYSFFDKPEFKDKTALEIGSDLGYTTFILSFLFKQVYGINEKKIDKADEFCKKNGRTNVKSFGQDVYKYGLPVDTADVIMVDAVHTYDAVQIDVHNALKLKSDGKKYFIFDNYGAFSEIKKAIDDLVEYDKIEIIKKIGYSQQENFTRSLFDYEGIICIEK